MNSTTQALPPLLDFLQDLMPPSHITLVGAGNGKGRWVQWLSTLKVPSTLVEADEQQFAALQHVQVAGGFAQGLLLHAVVAAEAGEVEFHTSSLATESGLLSAEAVQQLWPNVQPLHASQRQAIGLADVLPLQNPNQWLVLDCLPAASLLKAAASALSQLDVVVARVLLTANHAHPIPGTGLAELAGLLPDFVQLALQTTRHPAIAYALLVRDYRSATVQALKAHAAEGQAKQAAIQAQQTLQAQLQQATQQNADLLKKQELQTQAQQALEADLAKITQVRDAEAKAKQAAQQARADLLARLELAQSEKAELLKKQELQVKTQRALEAELTKAQDTEVKIKQVAQQYQADLQAQLDKVLRENAGLLEKQEQLIQEKNRYHENINCIENLKNKVSDLSSKLALVKKENKINKIIAFEKYSDKNKLEELIDYENLLDINKDDIFIGELPGKRVEEKNINFGAGESNFFYRPDSIGDVGVIKQIFTEKQYEYDWFFQGKIIRRIFEDIKNHGLKPLIIDAGSNIGASALWFSARFKGSTVVCIEPETNNCQILRKNCAGKDIYLLEGGLSNKVKVAYLDDPGESDWGFRVVEKSTSNPILCTSVKNVLQSFSEDVYKPLILKIDVEGSEDMIFSNPEPWINSIPLIIVELHDWMLPQKNTSVNFYKTVCANDFEIITRGENIFCFNKAIIYRGENAN